MLREDFSNIPELHLCEFKSSDANLGTVKYLEKVRLGQLSSRRYTSHLKTYLAASHVLSDVTLNQKEQVDCVQWYPADTGLFSTSSKDKLVKIWDPNHMKPVDQFNIDCYVLHHHMSPVASKHSLLSVAGDSGEVILCDLRSGSSTHRLQGHNGPVQITQWSPRNQHILVSGGNDHTVRMWDVRSSRAFFMALDMENSLPETNSRYKKKIKKIPKAHKSRVTSLCFTYDGLWLLSFSYYGDLRLWNSNTGEYMNVDYGETYTELKRTMRMAVSHCTYPDLVFVPSKSKILVYELLSGKLVNVLEGHFSAVLGVVYNPGSQNLYSFGYDRNFITWIPKKLLTSDLSNEEEEETPSCTGHTASCSTLPAGRQATQDAWSSDED
ncbi:DNA excision repair protein ERCC-8-like isoform X2 [Homarus americanus]|uniref:DNA excision repair protein ERCC-8-like isoform X2 n=1 Tax=Homarus americanus TaxID=6706 RepID=UPI001C4541A2|nr:DNA excision repair protein ERCC-8-like isoform X2 [Homarus americanus]